MNSLSLPTLFLFLLFCAVNAADAVTTVAGLRRGAVERNKIYGKHPSAKKVWLVKAALCAAAGMALLPNRPGSALETIGLLAVSAGLAFIAWRNHKIERQ
jgi:hypothetical protein